MRRKNGPYWHTVPLERMTREQWESLCDGCGKCCLHKFEDEDTGEIHYTNVACFLLDLDTCRCKDYENRSRRVHDCVSLSPESVADPFWLPSTCAYRRIVERNELPDWHPLISGTHLSVVRSGNSVCGRVISETEAGDPLHHLVGWIK